MPTSNPYPERAIASFLLVGAMGVALFFVGPPVKSQSAETPIIAQDDPDEPTGRAGRVTREPSSPSTPTWNAPPGDRAYDAVISEAAMSRRAVTPAARTSAAPGPTQGTSAPVQAEPTPDPSVTPAPGSGLLTCATPVVVLNELLCSSE